MRDGLGGATFRLVRCTIAKRLWGILQKKKKYVYCFRTLSNCPFISPHPVFQAVGVLQGSLVMNCNHLQDGPDLVMIICAGGGVPRGAPLGCGIGTSHVLGWINWLRTALKDL